MEETKCCGWNYAGKGFPACTEMAREDFPTDSWATPKRGASEDEPPEVAAGK